MDDPPEELAQTLLEEETFPMVEQGDSVPTNGVIIKRTLPEEARHRRLPHHRPNRGKYMSSVVAEIKVKVGTLADSTANRLVVRRLARGICETHGLRPAHQARILPLIIEACLIPSGFEIEANNWGKRDYAAMRKGWTLERSWWEWLLGKRLAHANNPTQHL